MAFKGMNLLTVHTTDAEVQRRGRLLIILAFGLIMSNVIFIPVVLINESPTAYLIILVAALFVALGIWWLGRIGQVTIGSYLLISVVIIGGMLPIILTQRSPISAFYVVAAVLFAGALLPARQVWIITLLSCGAIVAALQFAIAQVADPTSWEQAQIGAIVLVVIAALVSYLNANSVTKALTEAQQARTASEAANAALAENNETLELHVVERTAALMKVVEEQRATTAALESSLDAQRELSRTIADLSVPVLPISQGVLVVPLVGAIDSARANQVLERILDRVEHDRTRTVILDVTGVAIIDTQVAGTLLRVASATRLMGAETMLVGIRPEVAQSLVHLGVELGILRTAATLEEGVRLHVRSKLEV